MNVNGGPLDFVSALDDSQFAAAMRRMQSDVSSLTKNIETQGNQIESFAKKAANAATSFFSLQAAEGFIQKMVEVRGNFQQIEIAFTTMLKSKAAADQLMAEAVKLAAITPFTLQDVASGAKQLLAYGFAAQDITKNLTTLGNIAAGVGSQLTDVVYLYGTLKASGRVTQTDINQFAGRGIPIYEELAKVIGKSTSEVRDYVEAGKIGFPEVEKAFSNMTGPAGKFFNLMEAQSASLTGQLSNLEDAWDRMLNALGKSQEGIIGDGIQAAIELVDNYQKVIEVIELLIITYGSYRAALLLTTVVTSGMSAAELLHYSLIVMKDKALFLLTGRTAAQTAANAAYTASLVTAAASTAAFTALLSALVAIGYSLIQYQDAAEIAEDSLTEAKEAGARAMENESSKIDDLIGVIKNHNKTKREQKEAYDQLLLTTKGALDKYSQEEIAAGKGAKAIDDYKKSVEAAAVANREFADYKGLQEQIDKINEKGIKAISIWDQAAISFTNFFKAIKLAMSGDLSGLADMMDAKTAFKKVTDQKLSDLKGGQFKITSANPDVQKLIDAEEAERNKEAIKAKEEAARKTAEELAKEAAAAKKYNALLQQRNELERTISQNLAGARASALSQEDQQILSINQKYDDQLAKIAKINLSLKDKDKVSTVPTEAARNMELGVYGIDATINGKNGYLQQLDEMEKAFADFEQARVNLGEEAARKLYAGQIKDYLDFADFVAKDIAGRKGDVSLLTTKKNEVAAPILVDQKRRQQQEYNQMLAETQSFEEQRNVIIEKYVKLATALRAKGNEQQAAQAVLNGQAQLEQFDQNAIQQIAGYKKLFDGFERMSSRSIKEYIERARDKANFDRAFNLISQKAYDELTIAIKRATSALNASTPDKLRDFAEIFKSLSESSGGFTESLSNTLNVLSSMIGAVAEVRQGLADTQSALTNYSQTKSDAGGGLVGSIAAISSVAGPAGKAIGAVLNVAKGIKNFFNAAKESAIKAKAELQTYNDNLFKGEIAYNQLLRDRARTLEKIGALSIAELRTQQALLKSQNSAAENDYNRLLAKIQASGEQVTGTHIEKKGGFLGIGKKSVTVQDTAGVAGLSYDELEKLFTEGKLTDSTKAWFQELQKAKEEMKAIGVSGQDIIDAINEIATGTTASSIADAIISGFKQGKRSAADFADDFKGLMTDAALSVFKSNFLNKAIEGFYKDFAAASEDGLSEKDIETLRNAYSKIITDGAAKLADFDKIVGVSKSSDPNSLSGAFATASQESIDLLAGQTAGMRLAQLQTNIILKASAASDLERINISKEIYVSVSSIERNTLRTADNTDRLASMEKALISIDKKIGSDGTAKAAGF